MTTHSARRVALKNGYRSGLEHSIALYLLTYKTTFDYESIKIEWEDLTYRTYTPDFILKNGIIIETKGRFLATDRRKHIDIRFVFTNSKSKLYKGAKTTYAQWCIRHGFRYFDRIIPEDWLKEKGKNKHPKFIEFKKKKVIRRKK